MFDFGKSFVWFFQGLLLVIFGCNNSMITSADSESDFESLGSGHSSDASAPDEADTAIRPESDRTMDTSTDNSWVLDAPYCGDGTVNGGEECDPGSSQSRGGCDWRCLVKDGWQCITHNVQSICSPICGDSLWLDAEECEDGNLINGDGCSQDCSVENGWRCDGPRGICIYKDLCGDGIRQWWECCDDGNRDLGDGCSDRCQIEVNVVTEATPPDECIPMDCGNGKLEPGEECDDGANEGGYGHCGAACKWDALCGDGIVQYEWEECDDGNTDYDDNCPGHCRYLSGVE